MDRDPLFDNDTELVPALPDISLDLPQLDLGLLRNASAESLFNDMFATTTDTQLQPITDADDVMDENSGQAFMPALTMPEFPTIMTDDNQILDLKQDPQERKGKQPRPTHLRVDLSLTRGYTGLDSPFSGSALSSQSFCDQSEFDLDGDSSTTFTTTPRPTWSFPPSNSDAVCCNSTIGGSVIERTQALRLSVPGQNQQDCMSPLPSPMASPLPYTMASPLPSSPKSQFLQCPPSRINVRRHSDAGMKCNSVSPAPQPAPVNHNRRASAPHDAIAASLHQMPKCLPRSSTSMPALSRSVSLTVPSLSRSTSSSAPVASSVYPDSVPLWAVFPPSALGGLGARKEMCLTQKMIVTMEDLSLANEDDVSELGQWARKYVKKAQKFIAKVRVMPFAKQVDFLKEYVDVDAVDAQVQAAHAAMKNGASVDEAKCILVESWDPSLSELMRKQMGSRGGNDQGTMLRLSELPRHLDSPMSIAIRPCSPMPRSPQPQTHGSAPTSMWPANQYLDVPRSSQRSSQLSPKMPTSPSMKRSAHPQALEDFSQSFVAASLRIVVTEDIKKRRTTSD